MKVISIYPNFDKQGGAQDVVLQLAEKLNDAEAEFIVLTNTNFKDVHTRYQDRGAALGRIYRNTHVILMLYFFLIIVKARL